MAAEDDKLILVLSPEATEHLTEVGGTECQDAMNLNCELCREIHREADAALDSFKQGLKGAEE